MTSIYVTVLTCISRGLCCFLCPLSVHNVLLTGFTRCCLCTCQPLWTLPTEVGCTVFFFVFLNDGRTCETSDKWFALCATLGGLKRLFPHKGMFQWGDYSASQLFNLHSREKRKTWFFRLSKPSESHEIFVFVCMYDRYSCLLHNVSSSVEVTEDLHATPRAYLHRSHGFGGGFGS